MAQTVPLEAELGPGQTGLTVEYQIYDIDGVTIDTAWTSTNVAETAVLGTYKVNGGVSVDGTGAYAIFRRTSDNTEMASVAIELVSPTVTQITTDIDANSTQLTAIVADTNELQTDWADAGRLDAILDARASQASVDTVDSNVDAILADTGTDGVIVATNNDKTGYTLSAAGVQAVWDALTSALTTSGSIGKLIVDNLASSGSLAADVWTYVTRTLTSGTSVTVVSAPVDGSTLNITHATTYEATLSGLSIPATWSKIYFTVDRVNDLHLADSSARLQVLETTPSDGGDGLQYLNGAATTASWAALTVDQGAGTVAIVIEDDATQSLDCGAHSYDIKCVKSDGRTQVLTSGKANVLATPTKAVS